MNFKKLLRNAKNQQNRTVKLLKKLNIVSEIHNLLKGDSF